MQYVRALRTVERELDVITCQGVTTDCGISDCTTDGICDMGREVEPYEERQECTGCSLQLVCRPQVFCCCDATQSRLCCCREAINGVHAAVCFMDLVFWEF